MPDHIRDVTRISRYFNMQAPGSLVQALLFIALGMFTGVVANMFTHLHSSESLFVSFFSGMSIGIITITVPGILTVAFLKAMRKDMKLKHAFFAVLAISMLYSCALLIGSMFFALMHAYTVTYLILILSNAFIYGYWFLINRVVMDQKRSQIVTAAFQPVLNVLFFIPMGRYLLNASIPLEPSLLKLWSGMLVFMVIGYIILYIMDSPAKKALRISGVDIVTAMVNQWMYDITKDVEVFNGTGVKRDVTTDLIVLRGKKGIKAVFANPDIHYGPFYEIGGGIATEYLGRKIEEATGAAPFIMHGAVSIEDNPVSTRQIYGLSSSIVQQLSSLHPSSFRNASGAVYSGSDKPCRAIGIAIGDSCILSLSKAPTVTEDIAKSVGRSLAASASGRFRNVVLVDAHNSRTESSSEEELRGIYPESKYVAKYGNAIKRMCSQKAGRSGLRFGAYAERLSPRLDRKDLGTGYTSVAVFQFGSGRRFCMVYFDANNMLPGLREEIIGHINEKFGADAEVYTTDTHSVNTIALPASNVLGRETKAQELIPILDGMIAQAVGSMESVKYAHIKAVTKGFKVWGSGVDDKLVKASREIIRAGKRKVPIIIAAGFIIAAWVIYLT